jgi:hypothetical protein
MNPIKDGLGQEYIVERNMIGLQDLGKDIKWETIPANQPKVSMDTPAPGKPK